MIAYASRTGTKRNLDALAQAGWRLFVSAKGVLRTEGFPYALDNGAWWAHQAGKPFDEAAFLRAYELLGAGADFVVLPDIVAGGLRSLEVSVSWIGRLGGMLMLPVQDGMTAADVAPHICDRVGIFVGGTTEWKEGTMAMWGRCARSRGAKMHVGRVNTVRRVALCAAAGADSFDGSGPSRFQVELRRLDNARRQPDLFVS